MITRRNSSEINLIRRAGKVVAEMLETLSAQAKPGVTTLELDAIARQILEKRSAKSNFLNYHGYPAVICASPNNVIVHGIPDSYVLKEGDILSIDCGAIIQGYHADAAVTVAIGEVSPIAAKLIDVTRRSLYVGIDQVKAGNNLHEIGRAIQNLAELNGFSVVREYVGHGIGTSMHEPPQIPNYWPGSPGPIIKEGNVFAIEPMLNEGSAATRVLEDGWSVVTKDGSLSAHFEHTVAVLPDGPEVITC
jgi:methionyl aminopeptidase